MSKIYIKNYIKNYTNLFYRLVNNKPCPPQLGIDKLQQIDAKIPDYILPDNVKHIHISKAEFDEFEKRFDFEKVYDKHWVRYQRKVCEYLVADKILPFSATHSEPYVYIDAMSSSSGWASDLHQKYGINAYSVDINEPPNAGNCFIRADVTQLPFEDSSIDALSVQSGIELLPGEGDIKFIKEAQRVLKPNGKCIILPLYLNSEFCNLYGRSYYKRKVVRDLGGAISYVRMDFDLPFTRLYDLCNLKKRLLSTAEQSCWYIYIIEADDLISLSDNRDSFIYLRYALVYEKK